MAEEIKRPPKNAPVDKKPDIDEEVDRRSPFEGANVVIEVALSDKHGIKMPH